MKDQVLKNRLKKYTGLAAVAAATPSAYGQIFYTDITPDAIVTGPNDVAILDINNDGTPDFSAITVDTLYNSAPINGAAIGYYYNSTYSTGNTSNGVVFSSGGVAKLDNAVGVDANQNWQGGGFMGIKLYGYPIYNLPWDVGGQDKFVGVRLELNGNMHYGWVRLDVSPGSDTIIVKDMAINLTAGDPIQTGVTGLSTIEDIKSKITVINTEDLLRIETDPSLGSFGIKVTDLTGKAIVEEDYKAAERIEVITSSWPTGIYLVNLIKGEYIITEKIIVK